MTNAQIRSQTTDQIVAAIESSNVLPWRRPWSVSPNSGRPQNVISKQSYRGINPLLLDIHRLEHGFGSRWYGTFRQWDQLGCRVMKRPKHIKPGQWGTKIVFYRPVTRTKTDPETGKEEEDKFFLLKTYTVFSADQVQGAEQYQTKDDDGDDTTVPDSAPADELIAATGADIRHGGDRAGYSPQGDYIILPFRHRFDPVGSYYETIFHELAHWSESRLKWTGSYALNELVAEMSASFLSTEMGVPQGESLENHAAYLQSWLGAMRNDSSFIFKASTQASKVADFLMSFVRQEEPVLA